MNRRPLVERIPHWLSDLNQPLVLITARSAVTPQSLSQAEPHYREIIVVDDYDDPSVRALMLDTARRTGAARILSATEVDVIRAAWVREQLSLPGQTLASATAFRDKFLMKTTAAAAGIATPPLRRLESPADLLDFCAQYGFPVVVKPVDGGGSVGTHVLSGETDVNDFLRDTTFAPDAERPERRWMVEQWVEGDFFTIDGLMAGGRVLQLWPSRTTANLTAVKGPSPLLSAMLSERDPLLPRIRSFVADVVASLPVMEEVTALHAEVFHTPDDRLVFCEIASRPGGCGHVPVYEHALGVNLYAASLRGQAGCAERPPDLTANPRCMAGFAWFPPRQGVLKRMPEHCPLPGVFGYQTRAEIGDTYAGAKSVADYIACLFVRGAADEDLQPKIDAVDVWWREQCEWEPAEAVS